MVQLCIISLFLWNTLWGRYPKNSVKTFADITAGNCQKTFKLPDIEDQEKLDLNLQLLKWKYNRSEKHTGCLWKKCVSSKSVPNHLRMCPKVILYQKLVKMGQIVTCLCRKLFTGGPWAGFRPIFWPKNLIFLTLQPYTSIFWSPTDLSNIKMLSH